MKLNKNSLNQNRLGKAIKATLPLFIMMGGGAFASTRNQSASLGSGRIKASSVIFVAEDKNDQKTDGKLSDLNNLDVQKADTSKRSAFAVFSYGKAKIIKPAKPQANESVLEFLKASNLLSSSQTTRADISGDTLGRKVFDHTFAFTPTFTGSSSCANPAHAKWLYQMFTNASTMSCTIRNAASVSTSFGFGLAQCQAMHNQCAHSNSAPTVSGVPVSITVTEDVASDVNLSAVSFSDADFDPLIATFTASAGSLAAISSGGVTVGGSGSGTLTLSGTPTDLNSYLDTTTNIKYTTAADDTTSRNIAVKVNDGTVDSAISNITVFINGVADITSDTVPANSTYGTASNLDFTVTFDESVTVTGTPRIALNIGGTSKFATFSSGNATATSGTILTFRYTVESGLSDSDGIGVTSAIDLNSGTIIDTDGHGSGADLSNLSFASTAGVLVDTNPSITSATFNAGTGALVATGINFEANSGALNDVDVSALTFTGEAGSTYTLTSATDVEISSATEFTVTLSGTDLTSVKGLLNKNGTVSDSFTTYNLAAADDFMANVTAGDTSDATNSITVSNVSSPTITSATYDANNGNLVVTGANFVNQPGASNDVDSSTLTFTGDAAVTYTLTSASDVEITNGTSFTITLAGADKTSVESLLNKNGTSATDMTIYNLAAADNWMAGAAPTSNIADATGNAITVSNVVVLDADGSLSAAGGVSEPVGLGTTLDSVGEALNLFDFTLTDGGTADGLPMTVSQIVINVTGTSTDAQRGNVTWRLNGSDAINVVGTYSGVSNTLTFTGLSISIADNTSEIYTVNAYYNNNTGITEDNTFILSVDGDTDLTVGAGGTQMGATTGVSNGSGGTFDVTATALSFTTQPAGSVSGSALSTQPVVTARDAFGNTDVDFTETITVTEASAGTLASNTVAASSGIATFSGLSYTATADQQSFTLTANDQDGVGSDLATVNASAVTSDVVATKLIYSTEPAPTTVNSGEATAMTTVPVVSAVDADNTVDSGYSTDITIAENGGAGAATMSATGDTDGSAATVTITPTSGVSVFTGLNLTYTSSGTTETFNLRATSGGLTAVNSTTMTGFVDSTPATISAVSIPNSAHKVGDIVTATITVVSDADDYTSGSGGISGTIDGYALGSLSKVNDTTYTATFTITDGGTDVAAGSNIAVNFTLDDSSGNTSSAFTTAISQAADAIYANLPDVDLTASSNTLAEDGGTSTLTGTLSGSLNNQWPVDVTVNLAYTGTATITADYNGASSLTISSGGSTGTTVVTSLVDAIFDAAIAETIIVDIDSLSVGNEGVTNQQTLSITDAESAPLTSLSVGNSSVAENGGTSTISATLSNPTYADVTVNLAYSGTATSGGTDYNTPSVSITIPAGSTTANAVTGVTSVDDALVEGSETIIINITSVAGGSATENGGQQQTVTIVDDETVNVTLSVSPASIAEAAGVSTITATLSQATIADVIVTLGYTGTATDISDYTKTNTITILTGQTTGSTSLTSVTDALAETDETVIVDITGVAGGNANESGTQQQTITIVNNASPVNTVLPVISGNAVVGSLLSAGTGTWTDAENETLAYTYQWKAGATDITGATASSFTPGNTELGAVISVVVSASDSINPAVSVTSTATAAIDSDFDGDGIGDATDPDDDNDGMPDAWEIANGLNPLDDSDATSDLDGDGVTNLDEFLASTDPAVDTNPPVVTPPIDITLDAAGLFTTVSVGVASASDVLDGALTASSDAPSHFSPGVNIVTWSATDAAGNIGSATQIVNINPMVSFAKDQSTSEGSTGNIRIILNGNAVSYPVTVPYIVSGTAATDGSDHDLNNASATINSGTEVSVNFNTVDDGAGEGSETITLTMGTPTNGVAGAKSAHNITIIEGNITPVVSLSANQSATQTLITTLGDGFISVTSSVTDPNAGDVFSYDWSATDNALIDTDIVDSSFTFDPSGLSAGFYTLRLTVSDGSGAGDGQILLNILTSAPVLTTADSDGDLTDDQTEGYGDSDNDGIPEYLDAITSTNVLQRQSVQNTVNLLETESGLNLGLGSIAFQSGNAQSEVSMSDITNAGNTSDNDSYVYVDNLFDFSVNGLPTAGQSVNVVISQLTALPANAIYRNLLAGGWQNFVEDANNTVSSAAGDNGYCPPPGDVAYQSGLSEGHWCIQLSLEDGGINDADNSINNRVVSTAGITVTLNSDSGSGDRGSDVVDNRKKAATLLALGGINPLWLTLFGLLALRRFSANRKIDKSK